ncbi:NitT/TauT family transport system permease protein [Halarchaeum rubridurum]|uniref:NitT/TauT family transport system permease protein n=1 Tax=Halarchaeum rubridurum TaxID=489911 RepID=A0A830G2H0_9EURY|nr:ABC transporter permease [Halarchaeum rubridurum]MBP1955454.1 NitT/TauT family transport system permease protein [Halarchaeum rubridurum]GGM72487.1 putative ABC transporter, permease protein [Halarchaeum rubridurum]
MSFGTRLSFDFEPDVGRDESVNRVACAIAGVVGFLAVWTAAASVVHPDYLLPGPLTVLGALATEFTTDAPLAVPGIGGAVDLPRALTRLAQTLFHLVPGLLAGAFVGVATGLLVGYSPRVDATVTPVIRVLRPIPELAWIAFAIVWLGIGHAGAAFIVGVGALWINYYAAYSGVDGVHEGYKEVGATLGVRTHAGMLRHVVLPAALPSVVNGFRTSIGRCLMIVVGAELFGAPGVGYEIINASNNLDMARSMAYMLVISAVYICVDSTYAAAERRWLAWRP